MKASFDKAAAANVLYVIEHLKSKAIKIGITSQWQNRAKVLRVGFDTKLLGLFNCLDIRETELELHQTYKSFRLPGSEYFMLNENQIEHLIIYLRENFKDVTDIFNFYNSVNNSSKLEVTGAVSWSGNEWFRLNRERWKQSPIISAEVVLHQNFGKFDLNDLAIFKAQLASVIDKLKIVSHFGGIGEEQSIAAHEIWRSMIKVSKFFIDKRLYKRHCNPNGILHSLPRKISTENIESCIPDDIFLENTDLKLESSTVKIIYAIVADCRLKEKLESAMDTSVKIEDFQYYLRSYGPRN